MLVRASTPREHKGVRRPKARGMLVSVSVIAGGSVLAALAAGGMYALWRRKHNKPQEHPNNTPQEPPKAVRRSKVRGILVSASVIAGASVLAALAAGGTYALWNGDQSIPGITVTTGTTGLTINGGPSAVLDGAAWSKLLPGDTVSQQVTLKNTGNVSGTVTALTTGGFAPLLVHLKKGTCGATISGASSTVSPTTLGALTANEQSVVCIQVTMPTSAPPNAQGANQNFTVTFTSTSGS